MLHETTPTANRSRADVRRSLSGAAFKVWDALQELPPQSSLTEIANATGLSRSTVVKAAQELLIKNLLDRTAICPKCKHKSNASECLKCGSHAAPVYLYRLIGITAATVLGAAAVLIPIQAHAAVQTIIENGGISSSDLFHHLKPASILAIMALPKGIPIPAIPTFETQKPEPISFPAAKPATMPDLPTQPIAEIGTADPLYLIDSISIPKNWNAYQKSWFLDVRDNAEHSCRVVGDKKSSLGMHIKAWTMAKKHKLREELVEIILQCHKQKLATGNPQGRAFSVLSKSLFEAHALIKTSPEQSAIQTILQNAPFMQ